MQGIEANFNTSMAKFNLRVAQLEHKVKTAKFEEEATGGAEDSACPSFECAWAWAGVWLEQQRPKRPMQQCS